MTHEEAYHRLDLASGTDIQEVRRKFSAMHSDYRMRIDNAPTPRLRQLFEQQLEQIKEAYSFLNGSEGINDTVDLPRTKRVMDEDTVPKKESATAESENTSRHNLLDAYDYFGLSPEDDKATFNRLTDTKLRELKTGLQNQTLSSAKKLYEEELAKAEKLKTLLVVDRAQRDTMAERIAERKQERPAKEQAEDAQNKTVKRQSPDTKTESPPKGKKPRTTTLVIIGLVAVIVGALTIHSLLSPDQTLYTRHLEQAIEAAKNKNAEAFDTALQHFSEAIKQDDMSPASLSKKNMDLYTEALYLGIDSIGADISIKIIGNTLGFIRYEVENNPKKMFMLGWFYNHKGVEQNYLMARQWYEKAAEKGHGQAMNDLGDLYYFGNGIARNYVKAKYWYEKGVEKGNAKAMYNMGYLYAKGKGVEQDYAKAKYWYEKAAEEGGVWAMNNLGALYKNGNGVAMDYTKAIYWYEKAAKNGYGWSMKNLGNMYKNGKGIPRDYIEASYWYLKAAEKGNAESMNALGDLYYYGKGVEQDYSRAKYWYEKAAEKGYKSAMYNLYYLYRYGKGVEKDKTKADHWYDKWKAAE